MTEAEVSLEVMVDLALANAKRTQREIRAVVQDLARIRDHLELDHVQTEEVTTQ